MTNQEKKLSKCMVSCLDNQLMIQIAADRANLFSRQQFCDKH